MLRGLGPSCLRMAASGACQFLRRGFAAVVVEEGVLVGSPQALVSSSFPFQAVNESVASVQALHQCEEVAVGKQFNSQYSNHDSKPPAAAAGVEPAMMDQATLAVLNAIKAPARPAASPASPNITLAQLVLMGCVPAGCDIATSAVSAWSPGTWRQGSQTPLDGIVCVPGDVESPLVPTLATRP